MEQVEETRQQRRHREAVLEELAKYLRRRNEPGRKRWPSLDRPIVITLVTTLIGGGIVGGATTLWQALEKRQTANTEYQRALVNTKFALLRTLAATYQRSANVLNSWMVHVLRMAEERNKAPGKRDAKKLKGWASEVSRLHDEYSKAETVDGVLVQVEGIFSADVRATAQALNKKWESFENLMRDVNRTYNVAESIDPQDIEKFDKARRAAVQEMEALKSKLLTEMAEDIRAAGK